MHIDFKALTVELTDEVRSYVEEKLQSVEKLLDQNIDDEVRFEIELAKDTSKNSGQIFRADFTVHVGGEHKHAVGHGESLNAAIDEAKDELARRLRREKGKRRDLFIRGAAKVKQMIRFWE